MLSGDEFYGDEVTSPLARPRLPRTIRVSDLERGLYGNEWTQHEERREVYVQGETYGWDWQRAVYVKLRQTAKGH